MKKITFLILAVLFAGKLLQAQNIDEGRKFLYYDRFTSAKNTFNKLISSNAKNAEAIYWLGQTHLRQDDVAGAAALYQKALQDGVNEPLIWIGMGHVELLQGKKDQAKQRFEQAITATKTKKGDNPDILNAIGRANADGPSTVGDPAYGIEKLKIAAERNPKDPDIFINMGINYLKLGNDRGGDAYEAFNNALRIDPNNARAKYRLGRIFLSQGNVPKFEEYFTGATTSDAAFAPAYLELYNYYANRDVNKAREYLDKYVANTDKDCTVDYFSAEYLFRAGKYQESLNAAKAMETGACKDFPRLKVLYAYNYDRLGDSLQAKSNIDAFMSTAAAEKIQSTDYLFAATASKKVKGSEQDAIKYLTRAIELDTVRANRIQYLDTIAFLYRNLGQHDMRLQYLIQSYNLNPAPSDFDLYNTADAAISAAQYKMADSLANIYIQRKPEQEFGYSLKVRAAKLADVDSTGTAFPAVEQYIDFLAKDTAKNMSKIKSQYYYMASLASDKMKDYPKAIEILKKVQTVDPNDEFALKAIPVLQNAINPKPAKAAAAKPTAKPGAKAPAKKK
ncbi:tetratricopeptide repeat protein [Segetibacter sp. 3557_3]|uniref:tetratricopeptide repeat protein n=1 Tax=Segetibacter sp. 3557_3 TaxID=2547429 RepID=UPI0010590500|nr:tetratricopeptide repeat protein [Segetibacter sp. 3557_3]TDH25524.1 tetratricopeptide repeat protein [Segetibacter sp. 3557_3]